MGFGLDNSWAMGGYYKGYYRILLDEKGIEYNSPYHSHPMISLKLRSDGGIREKVYG